MSTQSAYYSAVQNILSLMDRSTIARYATLQTDESRFEFIASLDYVKSAFTIQPSIQSNKSSVESDKVRQRGNQLYADGNLNEALQLYNRSVLLAPASSPTSPSPVSSPPTSAQPTKPTPVSRWKKATATIVKNSKVAAMASIAEQSTELALALGNRSACLLQMKMYSKCLDDIDLALAYGYPQHLRYKLYDRMGRALLDMDRLTEANDAFQQVLEQLKFATKLEQAQKDEIESSMNKKLLRGVVDSGGVPVIVQQNSQPGLQRKRSSQTDKEVSSDIPTLTKQASARYKSASEAFDVRYNPNQGRYGVATQNINVGDVILVETPNVCVLNRENYTLRCYHCFKSVNVPYACHQCIKVRFCSEHCRLTAWDSYHGVECSFLDTLTSSETGPMAHLALRILVVTGLQNLIRYKKNPKTDMPEACQSLFTDSNNVFLGGFPSLYTLLSHSDCRPTTELLQYTILAVWITRILQSSKYLKDHKTDNRVSSMVGGTVLRFLQIISCNGLEIMEMNIADSLPKSHPESIGLALYSTVSLLNHSCNPALELVFYRNVCVARAIQYIRPGQELTIDYGYLYHMTVKQQRQLALRAQYYFHCCCVACENNWGLTATLKSDVPILKCSDCSTILPTQGADHTGHIVCPGCQADVHPMERIAQLQQSQLKAEQSIREARKFELEKSLPVLQSHVQLMSMCLVLPWKDYVLSVSALKQCYRMQGNRRRR